MKRALPLLLALLGLPALLGLLGLPGCCEGLTFGSGEGSEETPTEAPTEATGASQRPEEARETTEGVSDEGAPPEAAGEPTGAIPEGLRGEEEAPAEASVRQAAILRRSDPVRARGLYRTACEEEHQGACIMLANMLERGEGGEADPEEARSLFQQACFAGETAACDRMGH